MSAEEVLREQLQVQPKRWLVTGVAGFIGSNLLEQLLLLGQSVVGLDNFSTGHRHNLEQVEDAVGPDHWQNFTFLEADIRSADDCQRAAAGVDYVLHQAALGSVPRSIEDPLASHQSNVDGFLNMLIAARDARVSRFVYAASSSTYGDSPALPKVEDTIGQPLSPYAVTKYVNELYAQVFSRTYGLETVGLRYFNVFGPRQDPNGAYAAVIPRWFEQLLAGTACAINGDGTTSRDFCFVDNAVQANLLAATAGGAGAANEVYNVAVGGRTSLVDLHSHIRTLLARSRPELASAEPEFREFRRGDVLHSQADISKASAVLGYSPNFDVSRGLEVTADWFLSRHAKDMKAR